MKGVGMNKICVICGLDVLDFSYITVSRGETKDYYHINCWAGQTVPLERAMDREEKLKEIDESILRYIKRWNTERGV